MEVDYISCSHCGYEATDVYVAYVRTTANSDQYKCPACGGETSSVIVDDEI